MQDALRISNEDGRDFIQRAPLEIWKRPFAPLSPPTAVLRKLEKERRRAREAAAKAGDNAAHTEPTPSNDTASIPVEKPSPRHISHFVMNLPGSALEFLDAYAGSYAPLTQEPDFPGKEQIEMPLVHVHCFTKEIEPEKGEQDILEVRTLVSKYVKRRLIQVTLSSSASDWVPRTPSDQRYGRLPLTLRKTGRSQQGHVLPDVQASERSRIQGIVHL